MMLRLLAGVLSVLISSAVFADTIAYWNFNSGNTGVSGSEWPGPILADQGSGSIVMSAWTGTTDAFAGTTINALGGDPAGSSLSLVGEAGNGSFIEIQLSMAGFAGLEISFATRGTGTGFDMGQWSYSTDGANFFNFGPNTATRSTSFALAGPFGTSALNDAPTAFLRYTLSGATSTSGNNRIDNLQLNATIIPLPAAWLGGGALLGALAVARRFHAKA